jgi:hypothetical protein
MVGSCVTTMIVLASNYLLSTFFLQSHLYAHDDVIVNIF